MVGARRDRSVAQRLLGTGAAEVTKRATRDVLIVRPVHEEGDLQVPEDAPEAQYLGQRNRQGAAAYTLASRARLAALRRGWSP